MSSCLLFRIIVPFRKGVCSKRKEFAPHGSKFFPFRVDPFSEGDKTVLIMLPPLKVYPFPLKIKNMKYVLVLMCGLGEMQY